mgnify:CR=1 FL=1
MTLKTIATCLSAVAFSLVASAVECSVDSLAAVPGTDYEGSTVTAEISGTDAGLDSAKFSAAVLVGGSEVAATVDVTALDTGFTGALTADIPASIAARGSAADAQLVVKYDGETVGGRAFRLVQGKVSSVETRGFLDEDGTEEKFGKTATWYVGETEAARTDLVDEDDRIVVDADADAPVRLVRDEAQRPFPGNAVATINDGEDSEDDDELQEMDMVTGVTFELSGGKLIAKVAKKKVKAKLVSDLGTSNVDVCECKEVEVVTSESYSTTSHQFTNTRRKITVLKDVAGTNQTPFTATPLSSE